MKVPGFRKGLPVALLIASGALAGERLPTTLVDFHVSGTQPGDVSAHALHSSQHCATCHAVGDQPQSPFNSWRGSKMAHAGRNPLFFAQLAVANQDAANVGYYCLRCHVPMSTISSNALESTEATLSDRDRDGVDCHFCHSLVDPDYVEGSSPARDRDVLSALDSVPGFAGNAMFVVDPDGVRRGTRPAAAPFHERLIAPFQGESALCGTCHDVGNVAVSRLDNGTWRYNPVDAPAEDEDPWLQFPLERTYTEWLLSAFADGGVDMGGRFGGEGVRVVSSCQDCHMPRSTGRIASMGREYDDLRVHEFAGASVWGLDIIRRHYADDPAVDGDAIEAGMAQAADMLGRAASLELLQDGGTVRARLINQAGHKLPTGHIEGRRAWLHARVLDEQGGLLAEYGGYDPRKAELDERQTVVYEMVVGLSEAAAAATGREPGPTGHMALADTIVKDTRIPPRGFEQEAFETGGAPAVGRDYKDGQYWDDAWFRLPGGAAEVEITALYQTASREYIEELRDNNATDDWGEVLYGLWEESGRSPPVVMARATVSTRSFLRGDFNGNQRLDAEDARAMSACFLSAQAVADRCLIADFFGDGQVGHDDLLAFVHAWLGVAPLR